MGRIERTLKVVFTSCATARYAGSVKTINQRTLRNDNAKVLDEVENGETFIVTRNGTPVARVVPVGSETGLRIVRPAKKRLDPYALRRVKSDVSTAEVLDDLRGDR